MENNIITKAIIALEKEALDRWGKGDPSGFLEISAEDVCYFDPFIEKRIDGKNQLSELYEEIRGKIKIDRYELINPQVKLLANAAILTFNYVSYTGKQESRWNCTEVYRYKDDGWQIIQTHWSFTKPGCNS
jgi:ketosteroid isomerase-like protein